MDDHGHVLELAGMSEAWLATARRSAWFTRFEDDGHVHPTVESAVGALSLPLSLPLSPPPAPRAGA